MPAYDTRDLRGAIVKTLWPIRFNEISAKSVLKAIRASGFPGLSNGEFQAETKYLQRKGYLDLRESRNPITEEEILVMAITEKGVDLVEGRFSDVGVSCGK